MTQDPKRDPATDPPTRATPAVRPPDPVEGAPAERPPAAAAVPAPERPVEKGTDRAPDRGTDRLTDKPADRVEPAPVWESSADDELPLDVLNQRICDFDLKIEGRPLGKVIERFRKELEKRALTRLQPRFYLTDEWGVPEGTVAIGLPFYLADERLKRVHRIKDGLVEGTSAEDILRYLRHELGHVVNYAYKLYTTEEWTVLFGPMARPYLEPYRALPFSPEFVRHLPGGYAQKHPDEDWAETFAVWMTPRSNWREIYADSAGALAKLEYCDRTMLALRDKDPLVTDAQPDVEANAMQVTLQEYYEEIHLGKATISRSLDGDLQAIFAQEAPATDEPAAGKDGVPPAPPRVGHASALLKRQRDTLVNAAFRWTAVDPDLLRELIQHLAARADEFKLTYPLHRRDEILVDLMGFVTTLAMNYVYKGSFIAKA